TWPRWLAAGSGLTPVSQWNTVLLPEPAKPAMPIFMGLASCRLSFARGGAPRGIVQWAGGRGQFRPRRTPAMADYMPLIKLPLTIEQFHRLPRNAAYKYEYLRGAPYLSRRPNYYPCVLALQPPAASEPIDLRPLRLEVMGELAPFLADAFRVQPPFAGLEDDARRQAAARALERTAGGK